MLTLLKNIPFVGTAISFVADNARLVIEYVLIGVVISLCGTAFALWIAKQRTELTLSKTQTTLQGVTARVTTLESVNDDNEKTIVDLKNLRTKDAQAIDGLLQDYKDLSDNDTKVRTRLLTLESSNEAVRSYLNQPVPAELGCLLNNTCSATDPSSNKDRTPFAAPGAFGPLPSPSK